MAGTGSEITFQVCDVQGQVYHVQLVIDALSAAGSLAMRQDVSGATQTQTLRDIQKSQDGTTIGCTVGMATVTLSLHDTPSPPQLHVQARVFVPVLDTTYTLEAAEQQRLKTWLQALPLKLLS